MPTSSGFIASFSHPQPIEKGFLGGLAIDEPPNLDAGEGPGGLLPEDSLEQFGVIGVILEPERFILVVGDADQEGVEPGLGARWTS